MTFMKIEQVENLISEEGINIYPNVELGEDLTIDNPVIIGKPPRGRLSGELPTVIGDNSHIRPFSTIYAGTHIDNGLETGQCCSIREDNVIGKNVSLGSNATLEFGNRIGDNVRIHSGSFLELAIIEDYVFIGPNAVLVDDPHPMGCPRYKDCLRGPIIRKYARIGGNVTILPGVEIGERSLVGAGSVVVKDVPAGSVVVGNPAKIIKTVEDLECQTGFFDKPYEWAPYRG